jgi:hypothetical protein
MRPRVASANDLSCAHTKCIWKQSLARAAGRRRKRTTSGRQKRSQLDEAKGEGGPDEAVAFIAETVAELAKLAKRHRLELLSHLLGMAQLEAEERLRLRSKRKLS